MKLAKSLVITGLLFSSVLGSVNVNSINASAATDQSNIANTENPEIKPDTSNNGADSTKPDKPDTGETGTTPSKKAHRGGGHVSQRVRISFIDQYGDTVGFQQMNGNASSSKKIAVPNGYSLVNTNDATIKFDKSGNKNIKISVKHNVPNTVHEEGILTTNSGTYMPLYTIDGKEVTNRGLSGDSKWYTDQYATINGEKMFRVATNEWVRASDVYK